jgi:hypothetical protein
VPEGPIRGVFDGYVFDQVTFDCTFGDVEQTPAGDVWGPQAPIGDVWTPQAPV